MIIKNYEEIPADVVLLTTNNSEGTCFVETSNIDGESNLKQKTAHKDVHNQFLLKETKKSERNQQIDNFKFVRSVFT